MHPVNPKNTTTKMKKTLTLIALAGMFSFYACGPSAEEKAAMEKAKQDSIAAAEAAAAEAAAAMEKAKQDSIAAAEAAMAAEKAKQDSIAAAEEAKKKGSKPKTMEQKVKEEAKKATSGRG